MRTLALLTTLAMLTGCSHNLRSPSRCGTLQAESCQRQPVCRKRTPTFPRCDLGTVCRTAKSSCQKVCRPLMTPRCKQLRLGWKELSFRVPTVKLKQSACAPANQCNVRPSCGPEACLNSPATGCSEPLPSSFPTTPFLTLPPQQPESRVPASASRRSTQRTSPRWNTAVTVPPPSLAQRTQSLEVQVDGMHRMVLQRQASNVPHDFASPRRVSAGQQDDVIMLPPPPAWRTMDGVPPIPNSAIEQTGAFRTTQQADNMAASPEQWPHSPRHTQRVIVR